MNRRLFLTTSLAAVSLPRIGLPDTVPRLRAEAVTAQILPEGDGATAMLGFNGSTPGPALRVAQGQMLNVEVENGLEQGTAVHWHGIRLPNAMDGVPGLTQEVIAPGGTFAYGFAPPDAGTYWYHSHHLSQEQVARGMMGPLIVTEATPVDVDHDITALISDWLMQEDGTLIERFNDMHSIAHAGYMGNFARAFLSRDAVRIGDRIRLRLINAATNRVFALTLAGAGGMIVALDGMPLAAPRPLGAIGLAPAQRMDVIVDVTGPLEINMTTPQGPYLLGGIRAEGTNRTRAPGAIAPLPAHAVAPPSEPSRHLTLTMMGGAMGGRHGGSNIWAFNDHSDMPEAPFARFERGQTARLSLVNDTAFPHGIHLHGHHFHEVNPDGTPGDLRDTTLVQARESRDIVCTFDNPGKWMLHCHMLSHQAGGMKTWVDVA